MKTLSRQYEEIASQTADVRDTDMCRRIISGTEILLTNDQISDLSATHRRYLRYKLRRAIAEVQSLHLNYVILRNLLLAKNLNTAKSTYKKQARANNSTRLYLLRATPHQRCAARDSNLVSMDINEAFNR